MITPARVAYALQRAGEPLARRRATRASGAVVSRDGNSVVVRFFSTSILPDEGRVRRRMEKYRQTLVRRGFSVSSISDELGLRILEGSGA
jgi:hypothetical protein